MLAHRYLRSAKVLSFAAPPSLPVQLKKCGATGLNRSEAIRRLVELGAEGKEMSDDEDTDDPKEVERRAALRTNLDHIARSSAANALIADIYKLLVEKQILTQGDAVARLEKVSNAIMASDTGTSRAHAVAFIDIVRNVIAGDPERKPS